MVLSDGNILKLENAYDKTSLEELFMAVLEEFPDVNLLLSNNIINLSKNILQGCNEKNINIALLKSDRITNSTDNDDTTDYFDCIGAVITHRMVN